LGGGQRSSSFVEAISHHLTPDRLGGQGITTGLEYVISSRWRWRPELARGVSHYRPSGTTVESISMGIRF
jgi:hypothetical protein